MHTAVAHSCSALLWSPCKGSCRCVLSCFHVMLKPRFPFPHNISIIAVPDGRVCFVVVDSSCNIIKEPSLIGFFLGTPGTTSLPTRVGSKQQCVFCCHFATKRETEMVPAVFSLANRLNGWRILIGRKPPGGARGCFAGACSFTRLRCMGASCQKGGLAPRSHGGGHVVDKQVVCIISTYDK